MGRSSVSPQDNRKLALLGVFGLGIAACTNRIGSQPIHLTGTLECDSIYVASRAGGRVRDILVQEGATVEAGRLLVQLENSALQQKQTALRSGLNRLRNIPAADRFAIRSAQRQAAEAPYSRALANYDAIRLVQPLDRQALESSRKNLAAAADRRERALKAPLNDLASLILDGEAQLRLLDEALETLSIRAPTRGIVESIAFKVGDTAAPGHPIAVLIDPASAYILANATARQAAVARPGIPAKYWDVLNRKPLDAAILEVASAASFSPRPPIGELEAGPYFAIKLRPENPPIAHLGARVEVAYSPGAGR